jgi:hypothetical protein
MTWIMWNLVLVCLKTILVSVQDRCTICAKRTIAQKSFWMHVRALLGSRLKWKLISVRLEIVLTLTQDRCTVWAESTIGLEIILDVRD